MKTVQTKYRVFKIVDAPDMANPDAAFARLENCTHIEFEARKDAEEWLMENGAHRSMTHEYVILPCVRVMEEAD